MSYSNIVRFERSVCGMTVKIAEVNNHNGRSYKVTITTQGSWKGDYYSQPIPEAESFINVENMLQYIKRHTGCSDSDLSAIRSSIR